MFQNRKICSETGNHSKKFHFINVFSFVSVPRDVPGRDGTSCQNPVPSRPVAKFWACPVVPLSRDKEEISVPLSRKVALSRPVGNPSFNLVDIYLGPFRAELVRDQRLLWGGAGKLEETLWGHLTNHLAFGKQRSSWGVLDWGNPESKNTCISLLSKSDYFARFWHYNTNSKSFEIAIM